MGTGNAGLGTLNMQGGDIYKFIRIGAGTTATGVVNMTGGTIHNNGSAGYSSYGILNLTNGTITGSLYVGNQATSTGQVFMAGGKIGGVLYVGLSGKGFFDFSGGELTGNDIRLGAEEGSDGRMILRWPLYINNVYAGLDGDGELNVQTNISINYLKIGSSTKAFGRVNVSANSTLSIKTQICVGGSTLPSGVKGDQHDVGGCGEVVLNGGTIQFTTSSANTPNLFLGRYAAKFPGTFSVLRGYGSISPSGSGATNVRMAIGVGQVIADGAGENRTLDLNEVVNVTNSVPTGPADSNGWYAVNQGCVLFPRTWYGSGTSFSRCFGDAPYETRPGLVNSLYFTVTQSSQANNYFRGGVYATDRTDLHLETLPLNNGIVSCWKLGLFDGVIGTGKRNFTKISLTFRYDVAKAPKNSRFSLWRHDGTGWQRVGRAVYTEGEIPLISTSSELTPGSETFNVGIFAVTADKVGMVIIFR